jgi:hypothetical protein
MESTRPPQGGSRTWRTTVAAACASVPRLRARAHRPGEFMNATRGTGLQSHIFDGYAPLAGDIPDRHNGVLISSEPGRGVLAVLAAGTRPCSSRTAKPCTRA